LYIGIIKSITINEIIISKRINERTDKRGEYEHKLNKELIKKHLDLNQLKNKTGSGFHEDFKEFIYAYELPNITTIIEEIKKYGGLEYKGSQSYKIAKKRSSDQEMFWEDILKVKYKDHLGTQFKYEDCIFDFIHIPSNKIF
jgi:hypothetical protein